VLSLGRTTVESLAYVAGRQAVVLPQQFHDSQFRVSQWL